LDTFPAVDGDGLPVLLWIGDIDRDSLPDLFVDFRTHYNTHKYILFLFVSCFAD